MLEGMMLDKGTLAIIEGLRAAGYEANVVGGSVRNHLLGIPVTDVDITTSAPPEKTKEVFADLRVIETGIKHGTVTVLVDGTPYEITTYRTDGEYLDNRHPTSVVFTPHLSDDLARRDFTVNAICYNPYDGYTDLFDGVGDIRRRLIRAVGDPETRFREDALRILRAIRFASVLGFDIEGETAAAIHKTRCLLSNVSRERIYTEWEKLLGGEGAYDILTEYSDVIAVAIPELRGLRLPERDCFLSVDFKTRQLALFFLSTPDPVCDFRSAMTSLHTDNATKNIGSEALRLLPTLSLSNTACAAEAIYLHGKEAVAQALALGICLGQFGEEEKETVFTVLHSNSVTSVAELAINGAELSALGLRGRAIGQTLDSLVKAVIRGRCKNNREELITYVKKNMPKAE